MSWHDHYLFSMIQNMSTKLALTYFVYDSFTHVHINTGLLFQVIKYDYIFVLL